MCACQDPRSDVAHHALHCLQRALLLGTKPLQLSGEVCPNETAITVVAWGLRVVMAGVGCVHRGVAAASDGEAHLAVLHRNGTAAQRHAGVRGHPGA